MEDWRQDLLGTLGDDEDSLADALQKGTTSIYIPVLPAPTGAANDSWEGAGYFEGVHSCSPASVAEIVGRGFQASMHETKGPMVFM